MSENQAFKMNVKDTGNCTFGIGVKKDFWAFLEAV